MEKWNKDKGKQRERKVSDGQPTAKHGKKLYQKWI